MDAPETTSDARVEARANLANRAARVAVILLALSPVYVLSLGPVVGIQAFLDLEKNEAFNLAGRAVYLPVLCLGEYTPLKGPLMWYLGWWEREGRRLR
jgi:hypothetical protein